MEDVRVRRGVRSTQAGERDESQGAGDGWPQVGMDIVTGEE